MKTAIKSLALIFVVTLLSAFSPAENAVSIDEHLVEVATDTYEFFDIYTYPDTGLTSDRVNMSHPEVGSNNTSPTNIAMYLMSTIVAVEMDLIDYDEAVEKLSLTLDTLEELEKWNGLFYNWYFVEDGELMTDWGQFISTVDNGWLTSGLVVTGQYFEELADQSLALADAMDYTTLYDENADLFYGGYDVVTESHTDHHYGTLYSETRITSYLAIGKEDVPEAHWWHLNRTMLPTDSWQTQIPEGEYVTVDNHRYYNGHYEYEGIEYVPSWGGSMFEALMPAMVINEIELGTEAIGLNNARHVEGQIKYAEINDLAAWGFSPASLPDGYSEFGAPVLGISGYEDKATVTPHATFLALDYDVDAVADNLEVLTELGMYGDFGYYDSINLDTEEIAEAYLSLDQGMIMVSIGNYLEDGLIRELFHSHPMGANGEHLLSDDQFSFE